VRPSLQQPCQFSTQALCLQRPPRARIDTSPAPPVYTSWKWTKSQELSKAIDGAHTHSTAEARCSHSEGVGGSTLTRRRHFHSTGELHERRVSVAGVDVGLGSAKDDSGAYGACGSLREGCVFELTPRGLYRVHA
jgi:hypothetical protein